MKKVILLAVLTVFALTNGFAQVDPGTSSSSEVSFGAKGGVNFAAITGDETDDLDGRTGFHGGAVVNIPISELFAVQPEVVYSTQGATFMEEGLDVTVKLDYVNIPILADFTVAEGFSLQGGPQIGINVTKEVEAEGFSMELEDVESVIFEGAIGAQYRLPVGLFFQARYVIGITNINSDSDDISNQNSVFSLSAGWFFN